MMDALIGKVHNIDALELLAKLEPQSVDAIITDLPYGTTACSWDNIIPFEPMWAGVKRVLKPRGVFVTTASQPFTSALVMSNVKWFHEELIWEKHHPKGFLDARRKHLKSHESILVFCERMPNYAPQGIISVKINNGRRNKSGNGVYNTVSASAYYQTEGNFPRSVLHFNAITHGNFHPTQKPVALYDYLIRTYTQAGDLVVDFCCGSGTTAVAAATLNRRYIVGDTSAEYCAIARRRLETVTPDMFELYEVG